MSHDNSAKLIREAAETYGRQFGSETWRQHEERRLMIGRQDFPTPMHQDPAKDPPEGLWHKPGGRLRAPSPKGRGNPVEWSRPPWSERLQRMAKNRLHELLHTQWECDWCNKMNGMTYKRCPACDMQRSLNVFIKKGRMDKAENIPVEYILGQGLFPGMEPRPCNDDEARATKRTNASKRARSKPPPNTPSLDLPKTYKRRSVFDAVTDRCHTSHCEDLKKALQTLQQANAKPGDNHRARRAASRAAKRLAEDGVQRPPYEEAPGRAPYSGRDYAWENSHTWREYREYMERGNDHPFSQSGWRGHNCIQPNSFGSGDSPWITAPNWGEDAWRTEGWRDDRWKPNLTYGDAHIQFLHRAAGPAGQAPGSTARASSDTAPPPPTAAPAAGAGQPSKQGPVKTEAEQKSAAANAAIMAQKGQPAPTAPTTQPPKPPATAGPQPPQEAPAQCNPAQAATDAPRKGPIDP